MSGKVPAGSQEGPVLGAYATIAQVNRMLEAARGGYTHRQDVPSALWVINHNLGYAPAAVLVVDSAGNEVIGDVKLTNDTTSVEISFADPFSGRAYLR